MALDLSTLSATQQLAAIYIGYYDRAADPVGQDFWESAVANPNLSLADIATDFATQPETLIAYPFLDNPTAEEAEGFIAEVYLNLFNRAPDAAGLAFWSDALLAAIDGTGELSVGEIILAIIGGAQNSADGQDLTTILNKIEVSTSWTSAADAAAIDYTTDTAAQNSAKSIIEGVTDSAASVTAAKSTIDNFFTPAPVPGEEYLLTSATDALTGTADDDEFNAYIQQNPFAGGISNSLSSADRLDGGAGNDRLYAELTNEFVGVGADSGFSRTDVQPRLTNIEEIDIEARDFEFGGGAVVVDAKNINGHDEIGSYYSDGDLTIENLTTLTAAGTARNTSEITVTMDHTDNFNSDGDASDLEVYFDNDYLLSGQEAEGKIYYWLLDEDAELENNPNRLNNIDVDGIRFDITNADGTVTPVTIEAPEANVAGTHQGFVNALQPALQALIADGTLPAGTTLTLDDDIIDFTFLDDGTRSEDIPAIVLTSGDGSEVVATGFSRIEEEIGQYDVYGRFESENEVADQPISIDIDLHKAGRGGEGGNLIVGGKDTETADGIADGIEVFNINVLGAGNDDPNGGMTKPSDVGTITSTGNELEEVYIATDPVFAAGETYASLTVRNGFDENLFGDEESGDLKLINADAFLGDLTLGEISTPSNPVTFAGRITNADTITAQGGGDVSLALLYDGEEEDQAYSVTTGGGDDTIDILLNGDAVDYAESGLNVSTQGGDDSVALNFSLIDFNVDNEQLNQSILDNVTIETGAGDDTIDIGGDAEATRNFDGIVYDVKAGSGDDVIYTDGEAIGFDVVGDSFTALNAQWALNFDNVRADAQPGGLGASEEDDLPGVPTSYAYIGGAEVTVTLSGAGVAGLFAGGGVMSDGIGAVAGDDGYENTVTIETLESGNQYFGTQRDVNMAVIEAINEDPILGKLLEASMGSNNTIVVESLTSGAFEGVDLRVDIAQRDFDEAADWSDVEDEAQQLFSNSAISIDSLADANTAAPNSLATSELANAWYDGLSVAGGTNSMVDNLHRSSAPSALSEQDGKIDGGEGDDLIVLHTDALADNARFDSSTNALMNGASNQTVVLTGTIGDDTVMNFTTAGSSSTVAAGIDFLDFTSYLTSLYDRSTSSTSSTDSSDSDVLIPVTLEFNAVNVEANEVSVVEYVNDADDDATFATLSASDIAALFNNDDGSGDYDDDALRDTNFSVKSNYDKDGINEELIGDAKSILMVENAANDGEYKVFELTWSGDDAEGDDVSVVALGSIDFGDSLDGLTEANLVGSSVYKQLLADGLADGTVTPPVTPPTGTVRDLTGETAVTAVDGTAETFVLEFDSTTGQAQSSDAVVSITGFNPAEDILRFDDANGTPQDAATFLNGAGGALVAESGFSGNTTISFQDDDAGDAVPPAQITLVGLLDDTLGGATPFFEIV